MIVNMVSFQNTATVGGVIIAAVTVLVMYLHQRLKKPNIPTEWKSVGKVAKLCIYPFKSGRRIEVGKAKCTKQGLMEMEKDNNSLCLRDRSFVVYHVDHYEYRTARQYPKMILIEIKAHGVDHVAISAPNTETLLLKIPNKKENKEVIIKHFKKEQITSIDCGNEAAVWISRYIFGKNSGLRIAHHDGSYKRTQINTLYKDLNDYYKRGLRNESTGLTSDLGALHLMNTASVDDVNSRLGNSHVTINNFRPNLVIDDPALKAYEEDHWEWVKVNDVVLKNVCACLRCILTTIDPETGIRREDREPLKTMKLFRTDNSPDTSPAMGILLEVFETGTISVGDVVYVGTTK